MVRDISDISQLLGCSPLSTDFCTFVSSLRELKGITDDGCQTKAYEERVYLNYFKLGISFQFAYPPGSGPNTSGELDKQYLSLDCVDIFNPPSSQASETITTPAAFPDLPLVIPTTGIEKFILLSTTTALDFVKAFGEPSRKGGGTGPSSGSINIWCEWDALGLMVEFRGTYARGPEAWDKGKDTTWKVLTIFKPKP